MPFYFYRMEKFKNHIEQLSELRYRNILPIEEFLTCEDNGEVANPIPEIPADAPRIRVGDYWKGQDRYLWLHTTLKLPDSWKGQLVLGIFDFGITGGGTNSGFESLFYLNGHPYQGVDSNHKEVFLEEHLGNQISLNARLWSGLPGGGKTVPIEHKIKRADLACLDEKTDKLYYLSKNVWETIRLLEETNPNKTWLENVLTQSFQHIDFTEPGSDEFYASCAKAYEFLDEKLQGQEKPEVDVSMVGHTHIDCAWLWRLKHTREKCARSFSTVNRLMNRYDEYVFLQSQAQLYDYIKNDYPEIFEQIKKRVKEGKWEPGGSMWVECDCNVVSGESITRQILYAKRFFEKEFGVGNDYLWLPDVFGYSWALPQILKKSEVDTFVTTKISWNDTNKLPYDTFKWRGIDGSEVTTHFITTPEESDNKYYTYNGETRPFAIKGVWDSYSNKDLNTDLLIAYGYGDGGGGVNRDMLENIEAVKKIPGLPRVKTEQAAEYFKRLNKTLEENPRGGYIPTWDGELYLEFHRGTYTSQARNKKKNRELEFLLRDAELISVLSLMKGGAYPAEELYEAWKLVLCHQFHDIIPGSSIHEVYEDSAVDYAKVEAMLNQVIDTALTSLLKKEDHAYTAFNTAGFKRTSVIKLPRCMDNCHIEDTDGNILPSAESNDGIAVLLKDAAPISSKTLFVKPGKQQLANMIAVNGNTVSTPFYELSWNRCGQLDSILDKRANRQILPAGATANVLQIFEDKPRGYDAWELEASYEDKMEIISHLTSAAVTEQNEVRTVITFVWEYHKSTIKQDMILYPHTARIDFATHVNWQEREKILKTSFPVDLRAVDARYDIQYGNIKRPITRNTSWEQAKFETIAHKWVTMSETGYGVAILNNCKYGHDLKNNVMRLTLLRSSIYPDYAADEGEHDFTYALFPYTGEWYASGLEQEATDLNNPIRVYPGAAAEQISHIRLDNPNVMIDAVKKAEDSQDILVRIHEFAGSRGTVTIAAEGFTSWCECNLMEHPVGDCHSGTASLEIAPYEIKTVILHQ